METKWVVWVICNGVPNLYRVYGTVEEAVENLIKLNLKKGPDCTLCIEEVLFKEACEPIGLIGRVGNRKETVR